MPRPSFSSRLTYLRGIRAAALLTILVFLSSTGVAQPVLFVIPRASNADSQRIASTFGGSLATLSPDITVSFASPPANRRQLSDNVVAAAATDNSLLMVTASDLFHTMTDESFELWRRLQPIGSVTTDFLAFAVTTQTPIQTFPELIDAVRQHPRAYAIVGNSPRHGLAHAIVALILKHDKLDLDAIRYIGASSDEDALNRTRLGDANIIIGRLSSLMRESRTGRLRLLATTAPDQIAATETPPLTCFGYDVAFHDWVGFFALPRTSPGRVAWLRSVMAQAVISSPWTDALLANHWIPFFENADSLRGLADQQDEILHGVLRDIRNH